MILFSTLQFSVFGSEFVPDCEVKAEREFDIDGVVVYDTQDSWFGD
jgi:hypothetical protein